ncbi:probable oxoprolinase [Phialocephala subalpina]|uniref:Probable oxoprolinase n=1 Tax=Phialocephala subalpina TaxID=576137 RepID=A0A1L7XKR3_9HELO|nr:probable oxoprolinase [Phialocephala subalpina]
MGEIAERIPDIRIAIDRGGTFCDALVQIRGKEDIIFKLLSEDPQNYPDAPTEAIRRALEAAEGVSIPVGEKLDGSRIESCRIGTTVATNALLEKKGEKFALLTTKGFKDVCEIGNQARPELFNLNIIKPEVLFTEVVELNERVTIEDYDMNPFPAKFPTPLDDLALIRTASGEIVRILKKLDVKEICTALRHLRLKGYDSVAVCFMHSHIFPDHEKRVISLAKEEGFLFASASSDISPHIKILRRATSVCSEAYLYPIIRRYVDDFQQGFKVLPKRVEFMCSDGGLRPADQFSGNEALLSGPAGGVVGIARSCYDKYESTAVIGFDMGGTSTDISRYDGEYEHLMETTIAGRTIAAPMLSIQTVAAGGGSILFARNGLFVVGPESAGAHPGPACYRKGGPLTITDANLFLGRLVLSSFPSTFGPNAKEPLDDKIVAKKFQQLTKEINSQSNQNLSPEDVALGFLKVANESMSRPIRNATEARGFVPDKHNLISFGGAGGQHACSIARNLGIKRVLIHKYSSILSAYGISLAQIESEASTPYAGNFSTDALPDIQAKIDNLTAQVRESLLSQGVEPTSIKFAPTLSMRYKGSDTNISIKQPSDDDYGKAFIQTHHREFAFSLSRDIVVDAITVRGIGGSDVGSELSSPFEELKKLQDTATFAQSSSNQRVYIDGSWQDVPVYKLEDLAKGSMIKGPALIIDQTQTIFVEPEFQAILTSDHVNIDQIQDQTLSKAVGLETVNPVQLSVFGHRFMSIAEQMGNTLQRISISTSIKERLDFSCAIFSPDGSLVANAPHIPIHLGSMQFAIQYQHKLWEGKLVDGDVLLTNHPECGGTHLPDLTAITPVFFENELVFYVASRGHHTDIGGKGITSMVPDSKELWEEGVNIKSLKIVSGGTFLEGDIRAAFDAAANFPGCSATRRIDDNLSDLKAQISANQRGILLLNKLCSEFSLPVVHKYMNAIQANAQVAIESYLKETALLHPQPLTAIDYYDDGTPVKLKISINASKGTATFDFTGTGLQTLGNMNSPISITHSAVIYALRCLINLEIPLNQGCLNPITIIVPKGCILNPTSSVAVCGSTIASQRITDTIFRAFSACAASQGCANSFGWGMGGKDPVTGEVTKGWNYGEAIGGGSGAGPGWHGAHAVNVHATNTRNTDPEVIEKRTAVLVRQYAIRRGSGGNGKWKGGDGTIREIEARVRLKFSILSERRVFSPYGMEGGEPGEVGKNVVWKRNGEGVLEEISLGGKAVVMLDAGEIIQINTPGGGGWGTPE